MSGPTEYKPTYLSPLGFIIIDRTGNITGEFLYHVNTGCFVPSFKPSPLSGVVLVESSSLCTSKVVPINAFLVKNRTTLSANGLHWLGRKIEDDGGILEVHESTPTVKINAAIKEFQTSWHFSNPCCFQLQEPQSGLRSFKSTSVTQTKYLDDLPTTFFDVLPLYLDGMSAVCLSQVSHAIKDLLNESLRIKTSSLFKRYCIHDINNETMTKIIRSFDHTLRSFPDELHGEVPSWKSVFFAYNDYSKTLKDAVVDVTLLPSMSANIQQNVIRNCQEHQQCDVAQEPGTVCCWHMSSIGGGLFFVSMCPTKTNKILKATKTIVYRYERDGHPIYTNSMVYGLENHFFGIKVLNFPQRNIGVDKYAVPKVDRLLITANEYYINVIPILGGESSRLKDVHIGVEVDGYEPVFEIHKNILAIWVLPYCIKFYVICIGNADEGTEYKIHVLHELGFENMEEVWRKLMKTRSEYITAIKEYPGFVEANLEAYFAARNFEGNKKGTLDTHYGLCFISHLYGVESFRPATTKYHTVLESYHPRYLAGTSVEILGMTGQTKCSAKGHGVFIFCSNKGAAVSFDSVLWFFSKLPFPAGSIVSTVEMVGDNTLLIGVDNKLVFLCLTITSLAASEPTLNLTTLRTIPLQTSPLYRSISKTEFDFDRGKPIVIVTSTQSSTNEASKELPAPKKDFVLTLVRFN